MPPPLTAGLLVAAALAPPAGGGEAIVPPSADDVRAAVTGWVESTLPESNVDAEPAGGEAIADFPPALADALAAWDDAEATTPRARLDLLARTLRAGDDRLDALLGGLDPLSESADVPDVDAAVDSGEPFARDHARLLVARDLVRRGLYDEALDLLDELSAEEVIDPAGLLFWRAVCRHQLLMREEAVAALDALDRIDGVPEADAALAALMRAELAETKPDDLREVAGLMRDVERRLDLGRSGEPVRTREQTILDKLDKLIESAEQQAQAMSMAQQGGQPNGGRQQPGAAPGASPAEDSQLKGGESEGVAGAGDASGPGGWGALPPKQQERARTLLDREYPGHYGRVIERYFRQSAEGEN